MLAGSRFHNNSNSFLCLVSRCSIFFVRTCLVAFWNTREDRSACTLVCATCAWYKRYCCSLVDLLYECRSDHFLNYCLYLVVFGTQEDRHLYCLCWLCRGYDTQTVVADHIDGSLCVLKPRGAELKQPMQTTPGEESIV